MSDVVIKKIQFLTPALVTYTENGVTHHCEVGVDCRDRTIVTKPSTPPEIAELFFPFLTTSMSMPADSYEANEEIYEEADKASQQFESTRREYVGETNV